MYPEHVNAHSMYVCVLFLVKISIEVTISASYFVSFGLFVLDVNECRHYPGRLCAHKCENTLGSYKCSCTTGFALAADGRNCDGKTIK